MDRKHYLMLKRVSDIILSIIALVLSLPILLTASLAIIINDPEAGPLYSQTRVGKNGKQFRMYKLRTMYKNADRDLEKVRYMNEMDGPVFKIKDDPRITKAGKFLRKTGIDEIPQFWNVLKGDMSLVGPRPPLPGEVENYDEWHLKKLAVKPGITCYWQTAQNRNDIAFDDWIRMDLKYIEDMSLLTDLKILFGTVGAVLRMSGR